MGLYDRVSVFPSFAIVPFNHCRMLLPFMLVICVIYYVNEESCQDVDNCPFLVLGESSSSSSSDVDNLNNQATLGKSTSARGVNSPHIVGTHVIAARNHPHVMRLLSYVSVATF